MTPGPVSRSWRLFHYRWLLGLGAAVLAADQASKAWIASRLAFGAYGPGESIVVIPRFFYLVHVGNTGAAWSLFSGRSFALATLAAATLLAIFFWRRALGLRAVATQVGGALNVPGAKASVYAPGDRWSTRSSHAPFWVTTAPAAETVARSTCSAPSSVATRA